MELYEAVVDDPCNPSDELSTSCGQKEDHLRMGAKWVRWAEFCSLVFDEGRDPVAISLINPPGKSDKSHQILTISYLFNMEFLF